VGFCVIEVLFDDRDRAVDYRFVETNPAFERHTGLIGALGRTAREMVPDLDEFWFCTYGNVALTGEPVRFENHAPAMGRWFEVYALRTGPAEERRVAVLFTDITARKEAQDALRASEERERARLNAIFEQAPAIMGAVRGPNHVLEVANGPFFQLVGSGRDILGRPIAEGLPEVVEQGLVDLLDGVYHTGEPFVGRGVPVLLRRTPEGALEERFLDFTYQALRDADGHITGVLSHGIDLTARVRAEAELRRELEVRDAITNSAADALFQMDAEGRVTFLNPAAEEMFGWTRDEMLGRVLHDVLHHHRPDGTPFPMSECPLGEVLRSGDIVRGHEDVFFHKDGSAIPIHCSNAPLFADGTITGAVLVVSDITERKRAEDALRDSERRFAAVFEQAMAGIGQTDLEGRFVMVNDRYCELLGRTREELLGMRMQDVTHPEDLPNNLPLFRSAVERGEGFVVEKRYVRPDSTSVWTNVQVSAVRDGRGAPQFIQAVVLDLTERKRAEDELRASAEALRASEATLRVSEGRLREVQARMESALLAGDIGTWTWDIAQEGVRGDATMARLFSLDLDDLAAGRVPVERFFDAVHKEDRAHAEQTVADALKSGGGDYEAEYRVVLPDGSCRWLVSRGKVARDAAGTPVSMFGSVVDITERVERERERERLLAESRARAEREALVNQIGQVVRAALEPEEVLSVAAEALGKALDADRCYFVTYDLNSNSGRIGPDWHREGVGLTSIMGEYRMSDYAVNHDAGYRRGDTQVVEDVHEHAAASSSSPTADASHVSLMDHLGLRSLIRVPLVSGGVMTVLAVAMSGEPRRWTQDEVRLVETVAAQTRAAVEAARVQHRERNIAQQLQAALQPPPPPNLPGLAMASYYLPALEEAGVGGDFFDVFTVEKDCTALVVGDLSGKGLSAASEVATVRNMMRYALYSSPTIVEAVTGLDRTLVERDLLTGFATLFVGVFDQYERTLTYVNCGQEPGLIWRAATGAVEQLPPTGSVLGGFESTVGYEEKSVLLSPGDVLAVFTDGLTEVGPSRKELLEVEGVSSLLRECCAATAADLLKEGDPQIVVDRLMAGVDAYAGGGARDDIALLVGVVNSARGTG
jgi:PAS domain S-box-containing protein